MRKKRNRKLPRKNPIKRGIPKNVLDQQFMGQNYQSRVEAFEPLPTVGFSGELPGPGRVEVYAQRIEDGQELFSDEDRNEFLKDSE